MNTALPSWSRAPAEPGSGWYWSKSNKLDETSPRLPRAHYFDCDGFALCYPLDKDASAADADADALCRMCLTMLERGRDSAPRHTRGARK